MNKRAAQQLKREILYLANIAFTLDLYETGKSLTDCAEHLRQLLVVTEDEAA